MDCSLGAGWYCRWLVTDVSLSSSGSALRSSAYSDAILHIRCHRHAGKLSSCPLVSPPSVMFSSLSFSPLAGLRPVSVLLESCHPEYLFGQVALLSYAFLPPVAVACLCRSSSSLRLSSHVSYKLLCSLCHWWWAGDTLIWLAGDNQPIILIDPESNHFLLSMLTSYPVCCDYFLPSCTDVW